jgi:hypothetical protein
MSTNGGDARKSPEQLEREIDEERAHIRHTLDVLEGKLSPGEIFDKVLDYTRRNGGEFSRNLVDAVTHNPIPVLMTAVGISWMLYQQNRTESPYQTGGNGWDYGQAGEGSSEGAAEGMKDKAAHLKDSARHARQRAGDAAHRASEGLRQRSDRIKHSTQEGAQRVSQGFNHMLDEQPLALGALGIALGALLGGTLPRTRQEDRMMGEASDRVTDKVKQTAERASEQAAESGRKIKEDVKSDVRAESRPAL